MDPEKDIIPADEADEVSTTRWGRIWVLAILALIAGLVLWDLYPLWGLGSRQQNLRQIAEIGKPWLVVEPQLKESGFRPMPGIVDVSTKSGQIFRDLPFGHTSETVKIVQIARSRSFIEGLGIHAGRKMLPESWLHSYGDWKFRAELARIVLDGDGKVRQVD